MHPTESFTPAIAFLEDDLDFATLILRDLEQMGCTVSHFQTGAACLQSLQNSHYDICLFDIDLPDISGIEVMTRMKATDRMPPVIFMTSYDSEEDVVRTLTAGADDYVTKPPTASILKARLQALLRRTKPSDQTPPNEHLGPLLINYSENQIFTNGSPAALTGKESILAFALLKRRGQIISRQELQRIIGLEDQAIDTRSLDVHISRLRSKLGLNIANGWRLSSVYQRGYRLEFFSEVSK